MDWLDGQGLGKSMIGKLVRKKSGEERSMWIERSKWDVKIIVSYANAHQKVTLTEEEFSNHQDDLFCGVSLFPQPSPSLPNGHMNSVAMVAEMGIMHGFNNMDFHSPRLTWL